MHNSFARLELQRMCARHKSAVHRISRQAHRPTHGPAFTWGHIVTIGWPRETREHFSPHLVEGRRHRNTPQKTTSDADRSVSQASFTIAESSQRCLSTPCWRNQTHRPFHAASPEDHRHFTHWRHWRRRHVLEAFNVLLMTSMYTLACRRPCAARMLCSLSEDAS